MKFSTRSKIHIKHIVVDTLILVYIVTLRLQQNIQYATNFRILHFPVHSRLSSSESSEKTYLVKLTVSFSINLKIGFDGWFAIIYL